MNRTLQTLRALLIDMDGVLWVGEQMLPGVAAFFAFLDANDIRYVLVSNNATRRADFTVDRLARANISIPPSRVLTSADATPRWLTQHMPDLRRAYVIGEAALQQALGESGIQVVESDADAVIVGLDRQLTYEKLKCAALEIRRGAKFIATNTDRTLPTEQGLTPGSGSIVAALVAATDQQPFVIGKPGRPMFELGMAMAGATSETTAMLGDRLDTDIDGAAEVGLRTIMVLTGVSTRAEAESNAVKPDFIFADLPALQNAWQHALAN